MAGRPKKGEKEKLVSVGLSISPEQEIELKEIAEKEDREAGYIKRALYLRGLAAYKQDGLLREPIRVSVNGGPWREMPAQTANEALEEAKGQLASQLPITAAEFAKEL